MSKNFVNFHVLISHSPSCLNRDDMNMQKSAVFGGARRVRVSSQSLKRAMRTSDYYQQYLGERSIRTRELGRLQGSLERALHERFDAKLVERTLSLVSGKEGIAADTRADAVAPWSVEEFAKLCELVKRADAEGLDSKKTEKLVANEALVIKQAMARNVDIALSGRMATSGLMGSVDGAMAMAHSITTHAVDTDIDWFTAVDDLIADAGEVGAGHLDTQEFSSGVFYRYASLNLPQLQLNLGGAGRERALEIAAHLLHMMATVVPTAKQQSFAAHNLADFALVTLADQPISLANAFEAPVKAAREGGYLAPSISKLTEYWQGIHQGYGLDEYAAVFQLREQLDEVKTFNKLPQLEAWLLADGQV
ncbi:type I-E CRISPR-associated protein Cas7/Cse4/CasC [Chitinivorax sp. PXF-14]|uniref:type I-E CRISPR-associated protein Cas7/Cse4/CasC n=1 Tax=Chitinivorax sp. PXF-14 TaxID=3230488 RepID=UPI003466F861